MLAEIPVEDPKNNYERVYLKHQTHDLCVISVIYGWNFGKDKNVQEANHKLSKYAGNF